MNLKVNTAVDLIIPARDEEATIGSLLSALPWPILRHVIVADNGSVDQTAAVARAGGAQVVFEPQRGYGAACLRALAQIARHPPLVVTFIDGDLADDPAQLPRIIEPIVRGRADLVIGSRPRLAEPGALNAAQRIGNMVACGLIGRLTGVAYRDLGPFRAIRHASLQALSMSDRTWGWTVEMQFKAALVGLQTVQIDVPYRCRAGGKSKISGSIVGGTRAGCRMALTIARLWHAQLRTAHGRSRPAGC